MRYQSTVKLLRQKKFFDFWIATISIILALFGILMIYEASNIVAFREFGDKYKFVKDQLIWFGIGIVALIVTTFIPYKKYYFLSVPLILISLLMLVAVFIPGVGIKALGAKRWIGLGTFSFQPSELTKLSVILYLSSWFSSQEKRRFLAFILLLALIVGLVVLQPDLGTAIILTCIFLVLYFLSNAPIIYFLFLIPAAVIATLGLAVISPYRLRRLLSFLNPNIDPLGMSYHIRQILIALGSGGILGLGLGSSKQKYQFLPEATTDSIFAIIAEELGFIGATVLIMFFILLLYKIFQIARNAPNRHAFLLSSGILTLFACQIIINLGSMVALFPLTGVPLPFISYGGSNLVVSLLSIGILLNISKESVRR